MDLFLRIRTNAARVTSHVRCCGGKERPDQDGLDMPREGLVNKMVERYLESNSQAEDPEEGLMDGCGRSKRVNKVQEKIENIKVAGDGISTVNPEGNTLKKKAVLRGGSPPRSSWNLMWIQLESAGE